jgi:DNA gyrase subunit B
VGVARLPLPALHSPTAGRTPTERERHTVASASRPAPTGNGDYTARHLQVLEGLEAVRKRPGMYIGSTDQRGLMHCLWEIIDNAVDEALAGVCTDIEVILSGDGSIEVRDNGRGIPVDIEPRTGLSGVEVVFTKLHAGGKFGGASYAATGGLHGVGASVVNALSARLDVAVDRGGKTYGMSFRRGEPGTFGDRTAIHSPDSEFTPYEKKSALPVVGKAKRGVTGSRVRFWPDRQIFLKDAELDYDAILGRARQTSFLVPGLRLVIRDERRLKGTPGEEGPIEEVFQHDGGITDFVEFLAPDTPITDVWRLEGSGTFTETVPVLDVNGHMTPTELERECGVEVALRWGQGYDTRIQSFVNIITTPKGGTHVTGFEQSIVKVFRKQLEVNARRLKVGNDKPEKDDILAGMTAVVTVRLAEPQFEGQTKEVLGTNAVRAIVAKVVEKELTDRLTSAKRGDKAQAALLLEKVVSEMKSRISARLHKETQRRKNALESSTLPSKLRDCRTTDVERSELFIVEGDSAMGTAKEARNSEFQALLPIRGKILNVQKASVSDMLKNAECASIIQVIGAGSGRSFDLDAARYGKVIIMTDADVDGAHIRTLLLTLFFRYMRPLVDAGRVYAAMPPLHRLEVINAGAKKNELIYTFNEPEMRRTLARLEKSGKKIKQPMQRYKGLGEMDADQLADTTMDPRHRTLRKVTMRDLEAAERVFELLMGNDVAPRKDFIIESAAEVDRERIDA